MIIRKHSDEYNFFGDTDSGMTMRWGTDVNKDPIVAPWPELADISISNYCTKGCDFCYRSSTAKGDFMSLKDYADALDALTHSKFGSVFQVALGGGEPLEHPEFFEILQVTKQKGIIANFTTNGEHINFETAKKLKGLVGAVALSTNSIGGILFDKLQILIEAEVRTNVHFVLDNESINDAIDILSGKYDDILKDLNSIIFLTYKPKGRASEEKCLKTDERFMKFLSKTQADETSLRIGFDACFIPALMHFTDINIDYIDSCECGFFSIYVDEYMNVKPCSFSCEDEFTFNLSEYSMEEIWYEKFQVYRDKINGNICSDSECKNHSDCRGKCIYFDNLMFCYK